MFPIPGLVPGGEIDPVQLRAMLRGVVKVEEKIEAFAASGVAPAYFVDSIRNMYQQLNRWADETEAARANGAGVAQLDGAPASSTVN